MKRDWVVISCSVLLITACARVPYVASSPVSAKDAAVIRADSEAVETILNAIIDERRKDPSPSELTVAIRPDAAGSTFRSVAGGRRGSVSRPDDIVGDSALLDLVAQSRRRILKKRGVTEGAPLQYPACRGILANEGSVDSAARAACPKVDTSYVVIGLPHRGEYPELRLMPGARKEPILVPGGEVWSVIVSETAIGPGGGSWFASIYVLTRDPKTRALNVADKVLIVWRE